MSLSVPIIIRNAVKLHYPLDRVVRSVCGLADEVLICVDPTSEDDTMDFVYDIMLEVNAEYPGLVRYIESPWDLSNVTSTGEEFSHQTNIAVNRCVGEYILSLQADEAIHEKDFEAIIDLIKYKKQDAYSFERLYFYGDIDTIRVDWCANITRLYRKGTWRSCGDGMNSESCGGRSSLYVDDIKIYHYSRIGDPEIISKRVLSLDKFFHPAEKLLAEEELEPYKFKTHNFDCMHKDGVDVGRKEVQTNLRVYTGSHPEPFVGYGG